jgi:hypothetical protein
MGVRSQPISTSEVPDEFAERGVLVWRDTFASV